MMRASITAFVLGLTSLLLGVNNVGGMTLERGKALLVIFLILSIITFISSFFLKKR